MNIIYEDDDLLVLNKPAGVIVHPDERNNRPTLVDDLLLKYPQIKDVVIDPESEISRQRPGIVHRLDKNTSGLLLVAKSRQALINLQEAFKKGLAIKKYQALVFDHLIKRRVELLLSRSQRNDKVMMISRNQQGRRAVSTFLPTKYYNYKEQPLTLCDVKIETGRTHQIRVQASFIQHPIIGDQMYFSKPSRNLSRSINADRQLLHAGFLSFPHPHSKKEMQFEIELPEDFKNIISKLKLQAQLRIFQYPNKYLDSLK